MTRSRFTRRDLFAGAAAAGALSLAAPGLAFARALDPLARPLVVVILRGGLDGLAAVAPYADRRYRELRGALALAPPGEADGALDLGDGFGLHPALAELHALYRAGDAAVLHAASTPYRERSHFDGQDVLESGGAHVYGLDDGWLNRALQALEGAAPDALAVGAAPPLILRGDATVSSWSPSVLGGADPDTLARLMDMYASDARLATALASAAATDALAGDMDMGDAGRGRRRLIDYDATLRPAGRLVAEGAATLTVASLDGWDTHANQGAAAGALAVRLAALDRGLAALKAELGAKWATTAVLVATEFGRTAAVNGAGGTDHGTGGAAFLLGGAVQGGRVLGDWPGLGRLYQDRDVPPTNDLRALFKGVLRDHWGLDRGALDARVFPDSAGARAMEGVVV